MSRLTANLSTMFTELDFLDRFEAAAKAGFNRVEYLFPYGYEPAQLRQKLTENRLEQLLLNLPAGDWEAGERGIACHPDRVGEFRSGVDQAARYAAALGNPQISCLAGIVPEGVDSATAQDVLIDNLKYAAAQLANAKHRLHIEVINPCDTPGYLLTTDDQAQSIREQLGIRY